MAARQGYRPKLAPLVGRIEGRPYAYFCASREFPGKIKTLTFADKQIQALQGSAAGDGLFVTYRQKGPGFARMQIGFLSLPDGQLRRISRDTNSYSTLMLSADGKTLAMVQQKAVSHLFILPGAGSVTAISSPR